MIVTNHFFYSLGKWILEMDDPRNPSYITCSQADLNYMAILKNVCGQHTMRKMDENFNKETYSGGNSLTGTGISGSAWRVEIIKFIPRRWASKIHVDTCGNAVYNGYGIAASEAAVSEEF